MPHQIHRLFDPYPEPGILDTAQGSPEKVVGNETDTYRGRRPLLWTYVLLTIAAILFGSATAFGVLKLRQESETAFGHTQATMWLVVSFEREYLKLDSMFWRYAAADPDLSVDDLLTQFDVFWSRFDLMHTGNNARPLKQVDSFYEAVPPAFQLIENNEEQLFASVMAGLPISKTFLENYRQLAVPIHNYMVEIHINRSWSNDIREAEIRDIRLAIYLTLTGTLVSGLLLFMIVIFQLKGRQKNLMQTRAALAQSEKDSRALRNEVYQRQLIEKDRKRLIVDLESRNEELERYAYTVSHDLKSPLYTIQGFAGFLGRDLAEGKTDKVIADVNKIKDAVKTMSNLLEDILNLSRVNLQQEQFEEVALDDIVTSAIALVAGEIEDHAVSLQVKPNLPRVYGEPNRLIEVFQNLISNAAKFMGDQGKPVIEIGASIDDDQVICYVQDNGIGIAEKYRDRVFNLFERLDMTTQGTGIGLSIVKRIIERHGGRIRVAADTSEGCKIIFSLPASKPPQTSSTRNYAPT